MKRKINQQVVLKPQDIVVLLKLLILGGQRRSFSELASDLSMSASEVHASIRRAEQARLAYSTDDGPQVVRAAFKEFLLHGARYAFPATFGVATRGIPTAYAAPPLSGLVAQPAELPPVWPDSEGEQRGMTFQPLYPTVPQAARKDPKLYESLALFDALRGGAARERQIAIQLLTERFA